MVSFDNISLVADDPILGLGKAFAACESENKVNLGIGAYRTDAGAPLVFDSVIAAEKAVLDGYNQTHNKEYLPSTGLASFVNGAKDLLIKDRDMLPFFEGSQAIGGTGALYLTLSFANLANHGFPSIDDVADSLASRPRSKCHVSAPTWTNHHNVAKICGYEVVEYPYYSQELNGVDEIRLLEHFNSAKLSENDVVIIHGVAHNPTGADMTKQTLQLLLEAIQKKGAIALIDLAYLGFGGGSIDEDRWALDMAVQQTAKGNLRLMLAVSFSKNMGMYGDRLGCALWKLPSPDMKAALLSQVSLVARRCYSNPPKHPALVGEIVLNNPAIRESWEAELKRTSLRILEMRELLFKKLCESAPARDWKHIKEQKGMFAFTGLAVPEVKQMIEKYRIFMTTNGRISVPGLNYSNIDYVVASMAAVVKSNL